MSLSKELTEAETAEEFTDVFLREYGGWKGVGYSSDVPRPDGTREVMLVSKPHGFKDAVRVLFGKYSPHVAMWSGPYSR